MIGELEDLGVASSDAGTKDRSATQDVVWALRKQDVLAASRVGTRSLLGTLGAYKHCTKHLALPNLPETPEI